MNSSAGESGQWWSLQSFKFLGASPRWALIKAAEMWGGFPKTQIPAEPAGAVGKPRQGNISDSHCFPYGNVFFWQFWNHQCRTGEHRAGSAAQSHPRSCLEEQLGRSWACRGWGCGKGSQESLRTVVKGKAETRILNSQQSVQKIKARRVTGWNHEHKLLSKGLK